MDVPVLPMVLVRPDTAKRRTGRSRRSGASNIRFLDNTAGTWSDTFFSALGAPGSVIDGVTVSGNTLTSKSLRTHVTLARR